MISSDSVPPTPISFTVIYTFRLHSDPPEIMAPNSVEQSKVKIADGKIWGQQNLEGSTTIIWKGDRQEGPYSRPQRWLEMLYVREVEMTLEHGATPGHGVSSTLQIQLGVCGRVRGTSKSDLLQVYHRQQSWNQ